MLPPKEMFYTLEVRNSFLNIEMCSLKLLELFLEEVIMFTLPFFLLEENW